MDSEKGLYIKIKFFFFGGSLGYDGIEYYPTPPPKKCSFCNDRILYTYMNNQRKYFIA